MYIQALTDIYDYERYKKGQDSSAQGIQMTRIMIVDDHPLVSYGLAQLISQKAEDEFEIVGTAENANDALSLLKTLHPDMLIVDVSLEGMDGIEFIKTIKALQYDVHILFFSMYDEALYAQRALEAGADGYVMKQEEPSEVFNAIRSVSRGDVYFSKRIVTQMLKRKTPRSPHKAVQTIDILTDRELETFRLLGLGWKTQRIADELHISIKTVETYCTNIKAKLGLKHFNDLIKHAVQWVNSRTSGAGADLTLTRGTRQP